MVGEAVGKRQGELRDGVGTGLGDVVARDGHGVVVANAVIDVVLLHVAEDGVILRHEWKAFFDQVLVKEFGAEPLDGHKWATCPCAFCTSDDEQGVCACPK